MSKQYELIHRGKFYEFDSESEMTEKLEELNNKDSELEEKINAVLDDKLADYPTKNEVSQMIVEANDGPTGTFEEPMQDMEGD